MKICICSSMSAYARFMTLKETLEHMGHAVFVPDVVFEMFGDDTSVGAFIERAGGMGSFPPDHAVWEKKGTAMQEHFRKIDACDAILVTNYEKNGVDGYIGGNTFLEMGYAFGTGKTIFVLNDVSAQSAYLEEILGMRPVILEGDVGRMR